MVPMAHWKRYLAMRPKLASMPVPAYSENASVKSSFLFLREPEGV